MTILIDNRTNEDLCEEFEQAINLVIVQALQYEAFTEPCEISISIVDNEEIQQINKQFRNMDKPTDVLSFPLLTFAENEVPDRNENDEILLGDIILSMERAKEQAEEYGHSLKREVAFLTAHSMLHLLGYDHMDKAEEIEMFQKQEDILQLCHIPRT